ncbi:hypothetical protein M0R45_025195 [Rubus argutus]|uniref:Uncharacterized protein n=1 Tax=Rubus argutus TaxID=59490 RepID=A0AAW1WUZ4_RUBAR
MGSLDTAAVESRLRSSMDDIVSDDSILSTKSSIFVTPKLLFERNKKTYVPHAFSIGPLHHGRPDMIYTEKIKLQYSRDLIKRVSKWNDTILKDLVEEIASIEEEARQCYAVPLRFTRDKFVEILLVDGCFLIDLFGKHYGYLPVPEDDPVMKRGYLRNGIFRDLFLLENQIPWLVLDHLYRKTTLPHQTSLTTLAIYQCAIRSMIGGRTVVPRTLHQSKHILELLRSWLVAQKVGQGATTWELIPSASSLVEAGVKFKEGCASNGLLDIKFSNGVLEIPRLTIQETIEPVFRNLIIFEQCYHSCAPIFLSYVILLDTLINTPKDVDILSEKGIITNCLNPQEAAEIFNNLDNDTFVSEFYYSELCQEVNKYYKRRWPRWRAIYVRNHFSSPWAIASQVFAAIIFILALLQTVFNIKKKH